MIITIAANKGGTAKTTTATTIAHALAQRGKHTLLADCDPQGHASLAFGITPRDSLFDWLVAGDHFDNCTREVHPWMELLPGASRTKIVESQYRRVTDGRQLILDRLQDICPLYMHIVFDTPASGVLQEAAIELADTVIVPFRPEKLSLESVFDTLSLCRQLRKDKPHPWLLPVAKDKRLKEHTLILEEAWRRWEGYVLEPIPARVAVAEAHAEGKTIWSYTGAGIVDVQAAYRQVLAVIAGEGEL